VFEVAVKNNFSAVEPRSKLNKREVLDVE